MSQEHKSKVEIMQALKCCTVEHDCTKCPYNYIKPYFNDTCIDTVMRDTLALFKEADDVSVDLLTQLQVGIVEHVMSVIKEKATRTSYADMAVPGVIHETYSIRGRDLEEIEKELTEEVK